LILPSVGLPLATDFSTAKIFASVIFGGIGFAVFIYAKKNRLVRALILGIALMGYPYFISGTFLLYLIGIALTAAVYFWRD
jgi:hypothetical protein